MSGNHLHLGVETASCYVVQTGLKLNGSLLSLPSAGLPGVLKTAG